MIEPIKCHGTVYGVRTTVDQGIRITIDLPETEIMQMAMFAECKRMGVALEISALPMDANTSAGDTPDGKKSRPEIKSLRGS